MDHTYDRRTPKGLTGEEANNANKQKNNVLLRMNSNVKLVVSDTGIIRSWEGFSLQQTIDMKEKQFYPIFLLPGCVNEGDLSSIKIIHSKVGKI